MVRTLLLLVLMVVAPRIAIRTPNRARAATTAQGGESAIEPAAGDGRVFALYFLLPVATALLIAYFAWPAGGAGKQGQDAAKNDAASQIKEADGGGAVADEPK